MNEREREKRKEERVTRTLQRCWSEKSSTPDLLVLYWRTRIKRERKRCGNRGIIDCANAAFIS